MGYGLVAVGCSWGGAAAVATLLHALPADFAPAVVVVQHRGADSPDGVLARALERAGPLPVQEAEDKQPLESGRVYLAPPDYHLLVEPGSLALSTEAPVRFSRPSIDLLFETVADAYGQRAAGVVLTGANADGAAGLERIRAVGGLTIAQDPDGAERREMPDAAIRTGAVQRVLALDRLGGFLAAVCTDRPEAVRA
jgi:two-component system chemotaxis response regulator CheB